jgi:hypothetical protein
MTRAANILFEIGCQPFILPATKVLLVNPFWESTAGEISTPNI